MSIIQVASEKGEVIWAAIQSAVDVPNFPTTSGTMLVTESPTFGREPVMATNSEITDSYAERPGEICGHKAGTLKLAVNFKVSGTKGTLSPIHPLLLALYGRHTVVPNTSVSYMHYRRNPEDAFVYLTVLVKKQTETVLMTNVRVKKMDIDITSDKLLPASFDCLYEKEFHAGKSTLKTAIDGTVTPVTVIPLNGLEDYQLFEVGSYIYVGTDDNGGAGFEVSAVSKANNELTIEDGVTTVQDVGVKIAGFTPVVTSSGYNLQAGKSWKTGNTGELGVRKIFYTNLKFGVENGVKALENICSDEGVIGFAEGGRKVTLTTTRYYSLLGEGARYLLENEVSIPIDAQVGTEAGKILEIVIPSWKINKQSESGKEDKSIAIDGQCFESSGDDESTLVLK